MKHAGIVSRSVQMLTNGAVCAYKSTQRRDTAAILHVDAMYATDRL